MSSSYRVGTCHFVSNYAAFMYYAGYHRGSYTSKINGGQMPNDMATQEWVDQKIRDGEIKIGRPSIGLGERLLVDKREGRYIIETAAQ